MSMAIVRAFLSHTGADKEFVEATADRLGRASCIFDKACFHSGDEFVRVIEEKLSETDLFVLFASRKSLQAEWVKFEIDAAALRRVGHKLKKALVIALEPDISIDSYPAWLRSSNIRFFPSADLAAREIRSHLDMLIASRMPVNSVGRSREWQDCESALVPLSGEVRRVFVLTGLEGIGRRTLSRRIATDLLQLRRIVSLGISSADALPDLAFRLRSELEPPSTPERLRALKADIDKLSTPDVLEMVADTLRTLLQHGELPIFVDEGGLIDEQGEYTEFADALLCMIASDARLYAGVITRRKPPEYLSNNTAIPLINVRPLETVDVQRLLSLLLRKSTVRLSPEQLESLAVSIKGHPPLCILRNSVVATIRGRNC